MRLSLKVYLCSLFVFQLYIFIECDFDNCASSCDGTGCNDCNDGYFLHDTDTCEGTLTDHSANHSANHSADHYVQ